MAAGEVGRRGVAFEQLSPRLGIEVTGVDLSVGDDVLGLLPDLLAEHRLVLFRDQELSLARQGEILRTFGEIIEEETFQYVSNVPSGPGVESAIPTVSGVKFPFHADYTWTKYPYPVLSLYGVVVAPGSSSTTFADAVLTDGCLPDDLVECLVGLSAVHVMNLSPGYEADERIRLAAVAGDPPLSLYPRTEWPLLLSHPVTAEPLVFANEVTTSHIVGMGDDESELLLQEVFAHLYRAENVYEHRWSAGDLVIWDNLALHHARHATPPSIPRTLRRVAIGPGLDFAEVFGSASGDKGRDLVAFRTAAGHRSTTASTTCTQKEK